MDAIESSRHDPKKRAQVRELVLSRWPDMADALAWLDAALEELYRGRIVRRRTEDAEVSKRFDVFVASVEVLTRGALRRMSPAEEAKVIKTPDPSSCVFERVL